MSKKADESRNATAVPNVSAASPDGQAVAKPKKGLDISAKAFVTAIGILFGLMVLTFILTLVIPGGHYERMVNDQGQTIIDVAAGFTSVEGGIVWWRWLLSPFLVLGAEGGGTTIAIIVYLMIIGGVFNGLDKCGVMKYMLQTIIARFGEKRDVLMAAIVLFFMAWGSLVGSFEECVLLVPIVVALSVNLGWDVYTGVGMSLLADGCGFAAGICNPFTVGVAQSLSGLPMFSGVWLRAVSFVLIYLLLLAFLRSHAHRVQKPVEALSANPDMQGFTRTKRMDRALLCFTVIFGLGLLIVLSSSFLPVLQDYTMIIIALVFLIAGITSVLATGAGVRKLGVFFGNGMISLAPAIIMILMARSIEFTLREANVLDTVIHGAVTTMGGLPQWTIVLFIYLVVLVMNFFISSGSAKAFLLIPLIVPMAQIFGISPQLVIMAFAFGDGFSNVLYPTNPVLLISLGLVGAEYGAWFKYSWKFQLANLLLTSALLLFGLAIGY